MDSRSRLPPLDTPGWFGRRNCNVNLDDLRWDRPELDCEPQQARGIRRNLQLDETKSVLAHRNIELEEDIAAARTALRRMIKEQSSGV